VLASTLDHFLNPAAPAHGAAAGWPAGTTLLPTRRGTVRVRDTGGKGPVVLIVPDGPNVIEHHTVVIDRLSTHARVVCFDMPGFGFSRPAAGYDHGLAQGADVVLAVMDALDISEAALHFSCANGFYAIAAARLAPQRIRRLLLCQVPSMQAMRAWVPVNVPGLLRTPLVGQVINRLARERLSQVWYSLALPDRETRPAFRAIARQALDQGACFCLASVAQGLGQAQDAQLAGVRQPVTMLWGDADHSHRHTRAESLQDLLPQAEVIHFPGCGHFPDLERTDRYVDISLTALSA
jgi:pimeloyl-ACP methyl ester carboxylesterase